ncbi:MAG: 30S ribosomal protein S4e [Candidatus Thermoplasmatota archaeon]|nr:30S ribosomal protein S4e [Candidatus Thermoplasmatota archaeon]
MTRRKRLTAPVAWGIPRKRYKWVVSPSPGPHALNRCIPLLIVLRDMLHYCDNARESKAIIRSKKVLVDNRVVKDPGFPIGLMDTVSIPIIGEHYRVLLDAKGRFRLIPIKDKEAHWKLVRIEDKTALKGGRIQLNLSDGRNLLTADSHATRDTLKISLPDQGIKDSYPFKEGSVAYLIGGKHVGQVGHIDEVFTGRGSRPNVVRFKEGFSTILDYVFVVGKQKPIVALPEGTAASVVP